MILILLPYSLLFLDLLLLVCWNVKLTSQPLTEATLSFVTEQSAEVMYEAVPLL